MLFVKVMSSEVYAEVMRLIDIFIVTAKVFNTFEQGQTFDAIQSKDLL